MLLITPSRRRRLAAVIVAAAAAVVAVFAAGPLLRLLGSALVAEDPLAPADVIVLTVDSGPAGTREAAALVRRGVSTRIAIFPEAASGAREHDAAAAERFERRVASLSGLGASLITLPPVRGTTEEGPTLARWCSDEGIRSIVVVSLPDHSRRVRRVMRRAFEGSQTKVIVRVAPYGLFGADNWWRSATGLRIMAVELSKLLADMATQGP